MDRVDHLRPCSLQKKMGGGGEKKQLGPILWGREEWKGEKKSAFAGHLKRKKESDALTVISKKGEGGKKEKESPCLSSPGRR